MAYVTIIEGKVVAEFSYKQPDMSHCVEVEDDDPKLLAYRNFIRESDEIAKHDQPIREQLVDIDRKMIRAITDFLLGNDDTKMKNLATHAAVLRQQLRSGEE